MFIYICIYTLYIHQQQHITATHSNNALQHQTAKHWSNSLQQHTATTNCNNTP